jgi:CRISPR-associated protein Csx17
MPEIVLAGCTPEPLMSYLKVLGVFRLVAEQADPAARLSWRRGVAQLHSTLDRAGLEKFLLEEYRPTPIVGPWGARSGFYPGSSESSAREALESIINAAETDSRLAAFRDVILTIRNILCEQGYVEKVKDEDKLTLMQLCRNNLPDGILPWLDAVFVLTDDSRKFPPLLGTGGNEGSGSYVSTFAQAIVSLLIRHENRDGVTSALFADFKPFVGGLAVGHFNPGAIGGANSSQGFDGGGGVNAWDYVLAIEGCLVFAGAAARRYGADSVGRAGYPFCVEAVAVGYASESEKEAGDSTRAELWLPIWSSSISLAELSHLFAEGRGQLGRRQARNAIDFALAAATLGVSTGFDSFVRYAFVMRNGLSFFAAPLGYVEVRVRPNAQLLSDPPLAEWVQKLRDACRDKDRTPGRYQVALRQIDRSIFEFAARSEQGNDAKYLVGVLRALGRAEQTLAHGLGFAKEKFIRPLQGLNPQWLHQANDSREFRLAASVAGIRACGQVGPLRMFLEEVEATKYVSWSPGSTCAVWSQQPLASNLAAIFRRRQMEAFRNGEQGTPLDSPRPAHLADVIAFLHDEIDQDKLADLIWGLSAVDWAAVDARQSDSEDAPVPFEFGVPRLLVQPRTITAVRDRRVLDVRDEPNAKPDPDVFHILASGQGNAVEQSVDRAARRLKSGGRLVHGYRNRRLAGKPLGIVSRIPATRLLAAMLFPLSSRDLDLVANAVLYPPEPEE